ncbi:MAG: DUF971 domain-containing protein [Bacteroidota bacterium]
MSLAPRPTPPRITRVVVDHGMQTLDLGWGDGSTTAIPLDALRRACPCVTCQGGHEHMGTLPERDVFLIPSLMFWNDVKVEPVGGYGLRFTWDDGHDTGIYTWQRLRAIHDLIHNP